MSLVLLEWNFVLFLFILVRALEFHNRRQMLCLVAVKTESKGKALKFEFELCLMRLWFL